MLLNFLTLRAIKQPDRFGNHQRSLPPQESLGLVFHLKMLVFIKISNTNKVFPILATDLVSVIFYSSVQHKPFGYFIWYLISVSNLESEYRPRARFSLLLFIKPTLYCTGFTKGQNHARSSLCFSAKTSSKCQNSSPFIPVEGITPWNS